MTLNMNNGNRFLITLPYIGSQVLTKTNSGSTSKNKFFKKKTILTLDELKYILKLNFNSIKFCIYY